jgi:hypothetical protein
VTLNTESVVENLSTKMTLYRASADEQSRIRIFDAL